ncbi:meiotically up-regulated gene 65 protein [Trichoderma asperellum]|uniref:Meiotically up-regulated gene 65 protein n=1 Tax=Trichoderma asperellum TaxID=101201 RepID=A0A6V8QW45_TRIAP|nr:meiotically up-regulated gene 65 protein [Trichoderma asperellum]
MHGSRRVATLQPGDYDHEITILDDEAEGGSQRATSSEGRALVASNTASRLLSDQEAETEDDQERPSHRGERQGQDDTHLQPSSALKAKNAETHIYQLPTAETTSDLRPSVSGEGPSIEIRANAYHNPSPTDIHTAQVPDPSWEWVWPEWRINEQDGLDEGGWEYSFAFQKAFSWHGPSWWNSFVRRRAWIRKRAKKRPEEAAVGSNPLTSFDYFHTGPPSVLSPQGSRVGSRAPSRAPSRFSTTQASSVGPEQARPDIEDIHMLLHILRTARIDRERREAVENYIEHAIDLSELQHEMHEIMSLFIFQQSRRQLLSYLMHKHDETAKAWEEDKSPELKARKEALDAAVRHAEEEVCKLAYWSDVKQMAESGELRDVVGTCEGLGDDPWQGLDKSAPEAPRDGKMPKP